MKESEATLYQINLEYGDYPRILKKTFKLDAKDKIIIDKNGHTQITLVDACQSGHNGDWYDDHESGYQTFKQAKLAFLKRSKEKFEKLIEQIKALKETKGL